MGFKQKYTGFNHKNSSHKRIYLIWYDMKRRCSQPQNKRYEHYGGKGVVVCSEWKDDFQKFFDWSINNGYADDRTIDRIDVDGNYDPSNCRWADQITQANNRSNNHRITYNGTTLTMKQWSERLGISYYVLRARLYRGWSIERAMTEPVGDGR